MIAGAALVTFFFGEAPAQTDAPDEEGDCRAIDKRIVTGGPPKTHQAFLVAASCACLWLVPVAVLYGWLGAGHVYVQEAMFFSQVAVVTFGGAYAVLSYMAQQSVGHYGWLSAGEARRTGHGGNNTRAANHGHAVCRIHGCLQPRCARSNAGGMPRRVGDNPVHPAFFGFSLVRPT